MKIAVVYQAPGKSEEMVRWAEVGVLSVDNFRMEEDSRSDSGVSTLR